MNKENVDKEGKNKEKENLENHDEHCGDCGCGVDCDDHNHHESEDHEFHDVDEDTLIHLVLDDDTELECVVMGIFDVEETEYIALLPTDEEAAEAGVLLYKYVELDNEEFDLESIDEDEEFEKVSEVFYEIFQESEMHEHDEDEFVEYGTYDDLEEEEKQE